MGDTGVSRLFEDKLHGAKVPTLAPGGCLGEILVQGIGNLANSLRFLGKPGINLALLLSHYIADRIAPKTQYVVIFVSYNNRRDTHRDGYVKIIAQYVVLIRYKLLHIVVV